MEGGHPLEALLASAHDLLAPFGVGLGEVQSLPLTPRRARQTAVQVTPRMVTNGLEGVANRAGLRKVVLLGVAKDVPPHLVPDLAQLRVLGAPSLKERCSHREVRVLRGC